MNKPVTLSFTVLDLSWVTPTVFILKFKAATGQTLPAFSAGQFISITIPGAGPKGRNLRRAYSIASPPEFPHLELCVKRVEGGPGTSYLAALKKGDLFEGSFPFGDFIYKSPQSRQVCFIATGTGLAPFRAMALSSQYRAEPPRSALCLFGVTDKSENLFEEDLHQINGLKKITCLSRLPESEKLDTHENLFRGRVTQYLQNLNDHYNWRETDYYLCGNGNMIKEVRAFLEAQQVDRSQIYMEKYY